MASEAAKRYVREVMHIETGDCLLSEAFDAGASAMFDQFWEAAAIQGVPAGKYTPAELVVAIASAKEAELRQPMACEHPLADLNRRCGLPASSRSDVYCTRCAEIAKLKEPSSCGREGHLRIDWMPAPLDHICHEHCLHGRCLACLREDKRVREEEAKVCLDILDYLDKHAVASIVISFPGLKEKTIREYLQERAAAEREGK